MREENILLPHKLLAQNNRNIRCSKEGEGEEAFKTIIIWLLCIPRDHHDFTSSCSLSCPATSNISITNFTRSFIIFCIVYSDLYPAAESFPCEVQWSYTSKMNLQTTLSVSKEDSIMSHGSLWRISQVKFSEIRTERNDLFILHEWTEWFSEVLGVNDRDWHSFLFRLENESDHNNNILINPSMNVSAVVSFPSVLSRLEWPTSRRLSLLPCKSLPGLSSWVTLLPPLESSVLIDVKIILLLTDSMSVAETAQASLVVEEKREVSVRKELYSMTP